MTTSRNLPMVEVASRTFTRWREANFFRYLRHEYELEFLYTYDVDSAEPERVVPNPERKALKKTLTGLRGELAGLKKDYAQAALDNPEPQPPTMCGFKIANAVLGKQIRALETRCEATEAP